MAHHRTGALEYLWFLKTGKPARAFGDYDHLTLQALLVYGKETREEIEKLANEPDVEDDEWWMAEQERTVGEPFMVPKKIPRGKVEYDRPVQTGDPVADAWERAIARGEDPDFDASGDVRKY